MSNGLMNSVKIENMSSPRSGQKVASQFIIHAFGRRYFQSYSTVIAAIGTDGQVELDRNNWDYSATTGKYRNLFLGENKAETLRKIKSGEYILTNLN